jgi:branched-chain amino acid transport system substrate-binding protein
MHINKRAECTIESGRNLQIKPHPALSQAGILEEKIVVAPAGVSSGVALTTFNAIKIGFLSDLPSGASLASFLDPVILALEDAVNEGRLTRAVELLPLHVTGLPAGSASNVRAAYRHLVEQGCVLILSTGLTDNSLVLRDLVNESKVPFISMCGTTRFTGPYCFTLANGGHGEEMAIIAAYCASKGYRRVVVTGERSPGDTEYQTFFREQARLYGLDILKEHYFDQRPSDDDMDTAMRQIRDLGPDAVVYAGFGWNSVMFNPSFKRIGWNPPKVMSAAFMWALRGHELQVALDGWIGIEQTIGEQDDAEPNPNLVAARRRAKERFGYDDQETVFALLYDQGRSAVEAIANAPILTGEGMALGLERIKMMPCTLGGPRTYIEFGDYNHRGYKGDFLFLKQLRDHVFYLEAFHWPQWQSNRAL